jgi:hypothetical protein
MATPDYTERQPSVFQLIAAAGCTPQSSGGGDRDWSIVFLDRQGMKVTLKGEGRPWADESHKQREAVLTWLREHDLTPTPEAVQRVTLAHYAAEAARQARDARDAVAVLSESIAALRADRMDPKCVQVWHFHDAPPELRALSGHGGDEDWLALIPASMVGDYFPWMEAGPFGCCDVSEHVLDGGSVVRIGAHA